MNGSSSSSTFLSEITKIGTVLLFAAMALLNQPNCIAETFTMAFAHHPSQNAQYQFYNRVYTEAFKALGYDFQFEIYPSRRSTLMASEGVVDGEPQRVFSYGEKNPDLIRVEEPIFTNRTLAFAIDKDIVSRGLENLNQSNYKIDYIRGSAWSKAYLESFMPPENIMEVSNTTQGFNKLLHGHSDIFYALEVWALETLADPLFNDTEISILGSVGSNLSYPYLHKSHSGLAEKLADVLRLMKEDGRYDKFLKESMPFLIYRDTIP